jgi:hypothetical protein
VSSVAVAVFGADNAGVALAARACTRVFACLLVRGLSGRASTISRSQSSERTMLASRSLRACVRITGVACLGLGLECVCRLRQHSSAAAGFKIRSRISFRCFIRWRKVGEGGGSCAPRQPHQMVARKQLERRGCEPLDEERAVRRLLVALVPALRALRAWGAWGEATGWGLWKATKRTKQWLWFL